MIDLKRSFLSFLLGISTMCLFAPALKAQDKVQPVIDSLTNRIGRQAPDTGKCRSLIVLTELYGKYGFGLKAVASGQQALRLAQKLYWPKGEALAYNALGRCYYSTGADQDNALANYRPALAIAQKMNDITLENAVMKNIGAIEQSFHESYSLLMYSFNYIPALKYARQELSLAESVNDPTYIVLAHTDLGSLYMNLNDGQKAIRELQSGLDYGIKAGKKRELMNILYFMKNYCVKQKDFVSAEKLSLQNLQIMNELKVNLKEGVYGDLIEIYSGEKEYKKALYYSKQVLQHQESIRRVDFIAWAYYNTALIYMQAPDSILTAEGILPAKRYELAVEGFNHALQIILKVGKTSIADFKQLAYLGLSAAYAKLNDYPRAYNAYKIYVTQSDSIRALTNEAGFTRQAVRYDYLKKQDSLIYAKKLTEEQLKQQKLQTTRQQQALLLNAQQLKLSNNEKDIEQLNVLKTKADLQSEENRRKAKEQQLKASQKEKQATKAELTLRNIELTAKRSQSYYFMAGIAALLLLSFFIATNYLNQRKSNRQITRANHQLSEQQEEITAQRDKLAETLTELKQTQTQLIQTEKLASLGELTAGIAHEIQNPLNFVNNFSEVSVELLEELQEEAKAGNTEDVLTIAGDLAQNLKKINQHGKRADSIVKGMLEHSRVSTGQKEPSDLNKLADDYFRLAYHGLRAKDNSFNTELLTDFDQSLPLVNIVPQDIGRVLLNLYNNAFYALQQKSRSAEGAYGPEVSVTTGMENGRVLVKVKDNGNGIPNNIKDKIMQPFFTTKPTGQGTGLGLSLSYDIVVKGHGGSISVETKESEGSTFILSLPV
jgi:two-component system NtrC family sensor kinase